MREEIFYRLFYYEYVIIINDWKKYINEEVGKVVVGWGAPHNGTLGC